MSPVPPRLTIKPRARASEPSPKALVPSGTDPFKFNVQCCFLVDLGDGAIQPLFALSRPDRLRRG
jgi:hypothetical protein